MELNSPQTTFTPTRDTRSRVPEPPPVRLLTIDDAHLPAPAGVEVELDAFYAGILKFEREAHSHFPVYRSETFRLIFDVLEPPIGRDHLRPTRIEVPSLRQVELKLIDAQIEYVRQRGLLVRQESLALRDPAGNWVEVAEVREFR